MDDDMLHRWLPPDPEWASAPYWPGWKRLAAASLISAAIVSAVLGFAWGVGEAIRTAHGAEATLKTTGLAPRMWWGAVDPSLTPGEARTTDPRVACARPLPPRPSRGTWMALKYQAMMEYRLPWSNRNDYELDHLIPRELGGSDTLVNLWPQPWPEARIKDKLENSVTRDFCRNDRSPDGLIAAQHWFATGGWAK